jgi:hypothetical protein
MSHDVTRLFTIFCCVFGLKTVEQTELGMAISVQKEEKYIIFFYHFICFSLGTGVFVYGKRQERKEHYFNFT